MITSCYIALGSNVTSYFGGPTETLIEAISHLETESVNVTQKSRFFRTPAFPEGSGPEFINAAVQVETTLAPGDLMDHLAGIETHFGRVRTDRWGPRVIDLDLLSFGDAVLPDLTGYAYWRDLSLEDQKRRAPTDLIVPHPRLHERGFVLVPMSDIAPSWRHPVSGLSVRDMLDALPDALLAEIKPL